MTSSKPHIVYLPGFVTVDIVESLRMAIAKIRPGQLKIRGEYLPPKHKLPIPHLKIPKPLYTTNRVSLTDLDEPSKAKARRVRRELLDAGITLYGLLKSESRILPKMIHPNEHIEAVVYGQHHASSVMLVATDERIIYLDKKPMAAFLDEVSYEVISGLQFEIHTLYATLILHTPVKNYDIRYANLRCAEHFARHIEAHRLKREQPDKEPEFIAAEHNVTKHAATEEYPYELKEDMAGYYWLPNEEEERERLQVGP